jgi:hypothetical protein
MMSGSTEAVKEAMAMEAEAVENVEAAQVEQKRGAVGLSLELLLEAMRKERQGLDKLEEGIEVLRNSLEERRHALNQQEELLNQFIVTQRKKEEGSSDAERR